MLVKKITKVALLISAIFAVSFAVNSTTLGIVSKDDAKAQSDYAVFLKLLKEKGNIEGNL